MRRSPRARRRLLAMSDADRLEVLRPFDRGSLKYAESTSFGPLKSRPDDRGIKALVIYPMNALAMDQARRFAEAVAKAEAFQGLRVGLFIGGHHGQRGSGVVMTPTSVITDRDTLRKTPPDVLLTNYKMLDYLLLRPKDRQLWSRNSPTTLRYVVVDELHTFDGAQGTDLALLLRRLRARLQVPGGHLICVGTSATLGVSGDTGPLREYARQVFCVIICGRLSHRRRPAFRCRLSW